MPSGPVGNGRKGCVGEEASSPESVAAAFAQRSVLLPCVPDAPAMTIPWVSSTVNGLSGLSVGTERTGGR